MSRTGRAADSYTVAGAWWKPHGARQESRFLSDSGEARPMVSILCRSTLFEVR